MKSNNLYNQNWDDKWPITRELINKLITTPQQAQKEENKKEEEKEKEITLKEINLLREFVIGFSKKILNCEINNSLNNQEIKQLAVELYYYNFFLVETEKYKEPEQLVKYFVLEKDFIAFAIQQLNPYITKSYFILLLNILSGYIEKNKDIPTSLFLTAFDLFKKALSKMQTALSGQKISNYWIVLSAMTNYIASLISFIHLAPPNKTEGLYFLDTAKNMIQLMLPDGKNSDDETNHNLNYISLCQELKLNSIQELQSLIDNLESTFK